MKRKTESVAGIVIICLLVGLSISSALWGEWLDFVCSLIWLLTTIFLIQKSKLCYNLEERFDRLVELVEHIRRDTAEVKTLNNPVCAEPKEPQSEPEQIEEKTELNVYKGNYSLLYVTYKGVPLPVMSVSEFASLVGVSARTLSRNYSQKDVYEKNGYVARCIKKSKGRKPISIKVTDSKGNHRIFPTLSVFCEKFNIPRTTFYNMRVGNPDGPWKYNGFVIEKVKTLPLETSKKQ